MTYATLRPCSGRAAFEAVPRPPQAIDLRRVRDRFVAEGVRVIDARVMLIVELEREVTIARDGRILIKSNDAGEADRIFGQVRAFLGR